VLQDINDVTSAHLASHDTVVHLAAVAHTHATSDDDIWRCNVDGTRKLHRAALEAGVGHFIFISSIKALAESSDMPLTPDSMLAPEDVYGRSKHAAETYLAEANGPATSIVRIPLVYGDGVKGNFHTLERVAKLPLPLPFGGLTNKRSYVCVDNLCGAIEAIIRKPPEGYRVFHVADRETLSITEVLTIVRNAAGRSPSLFRLPLPLLTILCELVLGRDRTFKLLGKLEMDIRETTRTLDWQPSITMSRYFDARSKSN